jgi:hypothetical protein
VALRANSAGLGMPMAVKSERVGGWNGPSPSITKIDPPSSMYVCSASNCSSKCVHAREMLAVSECQPAHMSACEQLSCAWIDWLKV